MTTLTGHVAVITGASSGIGAATAIELAKRGAHVALAARRASKLEDLVARIKKDGGKALAVACDVTQREDVERLVETTNQRLGHVQTLINNAGVMPLSMIEDRRVDDWTR